MQSRVAIGLTESVEYWPGGQTLGTAVPAAQCSPATQATISVDVFPVVIKPGIAPMHLNKTVQFMP